MLSGSPVSRILSPADRVSGRRPLIWDPPRDGTRTTYPGVLAMRATSSSPIWSLSGWGLPSQAGHPACWCALTAPFHPYPVKPGGILSVALSLFFRTVGVTHHPALWSTDFPPPPRTAGAAARTPRKRAHTNHDPVSVSMAKSLLVKTAPIGNRKGRTQVGVDQEGKVLSSPVGMA